MTFWKGHFKTPCNETASKDTFLKLKGWKKGIAYINGINLGLCEDLEILFDLKTNLQYVFFFIYVQQLI